MFGDQLPGPPLCPGPGTVLSPHVTQPLCVGFAVGELDCLHCGFNPLVEGSEREEADGPGEGWRAYGVTLGSFIGNLESVKAGTTQGHGYCESCDWEASLEVSISPHMQLDICSMKTTWWG